MCLDSFVHATFLFNRVSFNGSPLCFREISSKVEHFFKNYLTHNIHRVRKVVTVMG